MGMGRGSCDLRLKGESTEGLYDPKRGSLGLYQLSGLGVPEVNRMVNPESSSRECVALLSLHAPRRGVLLRVQGSCG